MATIFYSPSANILLLRYIFYTYTYYQTSDNSLVCPDTAELLYGDLVEVVEV